ncbi:hypothetical protein Q8A67_003014 [Cirrhinus molitorella]|uniref:Cystatin domain-containing protein n=1 Tax=Cirrhinus molitorella TaxID=172907 RepID=A0AA88QEK4_9TELE|nr:hypothetical protein Q8A67_003014 [Cirrhinus molitorella]
MPGAPHLKRAPDGRPFKSKGKFIARSDISPSPLLHYTGYAFATSAALFKQVKPLIKERVDNDSAVYIPLLYASQIVEGTNYVVKVLLNLDGLCVHVKIYQPLACDGEPPKVMEIQFPKTFDDPLTPF